MSVQLIVFPQSYEGQYSTYSSAVLNEYVSNFTFNSTSNGTVHSSTASNIVADVMANVQPLNQWQSWRSTGGTWATASAPSFTTGKVTLDSASSDSSSGIFQLINNLVVGVSYELNIEILVGSSGVITLGHSTNWTFNSVIYEPILYNSFQASVNTHTFTFTATNTQMVFILNYLNDDNTNLEVGSVSIKEASPTTIDTYSDGQVILDLYEESNIPLSLSIDNFKNVAQKSQSYSKAFKLPSTKRNNKIFSSLFDITRSVRNDVYAFNPYRKTKAILKEDGYTIFDGYLKLIEITEKEEEVSYNVNLYGDTITLMDTLKDKKFRDIDFSELYHLYNKDNIKLTHLNDNGVTLVNNLSTSSFAYTASFQSGALNKTSVIKYPFVKWNGDSYLDSGNVVLQDLADAFRPFINCKYLVDRIITEAGFTYNSDFLESTDFTKLFMDFNWGNDNTPNDSSGGVNHWLEGNITTFAGTSYTTIPIDGLNLAAVSGAYSNISQHDPTNSRFVADADSQKYYVSYNFHIKNTDSSSRDVTFRWSHKNSSGTLINEIDLTTQTIVAGGTYTYQSSSGFDVSLDNGDTLQAEFLASAGSVVRLDDIYISSQLDNIDVLVQVQNVNMVNDGSLHSLRGNLGQWEFLKGLFTMFNLMILQDKDNPSNLIIEPYEAVFIDDSQSQYITHSTHDWTSKVDISEMKLKPLKLKKKVLFDFVKQDKDYATKVYESATGYKFGSYILDATEFDLLEGEQKIEAKPFGATFSKPIFDAFTTEMTIPVIYSGKDDGTFEGFENKPRILYNNGRVTMGNNTYKIPQQNGLASEDQASFLQFSHLSEIPTTATTKDYNFNTGQLIGSLGGSPVANLFNEYHLPYYDELYDPDTRTMTLKVYLNPSDISNFEFYDKIRIKNRIFRVNKIDYKPYELSTVEFILL